MSRIVFALALTTFLWSAQSRSIAQEVLRIDNIMWQDPELLVPPHIHSFPSQLVSLWSQALARTDTELQRTGADTVAIAQQRGVQGLSELIPHLVRIVGDEQSDRVVRRAAAHALVVLDARDHADVLAKAAQREGFEVALFVEPALAKWKYEPMRSTWLQRLSQPSLQNVNLILAIRCLGEMKETQARTELLKMVYNVRAPYNIRLESARSLAQIFPDDLLDEARKLAARAEGKSYLDRLFAVTFLSSHDDSDSIEMLRQFANDPEPTIAAIAWERLFSIVPAQTHDLAPGALKNSDVNIRRYGSRSLVHKSDADAIRLLAPMMDDRNPSLRQWIAKSLVDLAAKSELRDVVIETTVSMLNSQSWRGLEQAALVAVTLEQKGVAPRLIELLDHPRTEVAVTSAWGLRRFQLPETLPVMLAHAQKQYDRHAAKAIGNDFELIVGQHSQLFQAFGQMRYQEAGPLMRNFVPKRLELGVDSRVAACWALGYLYENQAPEDLASQFVERLSDVASVPPEATPVRTSCAVSLGRMKSLSQVRTLTQFAETEGVITETGLACWWSLERMTDAKRPPTPKLTQTILGWFIQPNE